MKNKPQIAGQGLPRHWRDSARRALVTEGKGLSELIDAMDGPLGEAVSEAIALIGKARGRVILSGVGKSGHVARKIAATLSSTGTPALFVHAAEAGHGDLGMITRDDIVLAVSTSGESPELRAIVNHAKRFAVPLVAMTARPQSTLARAADVVLAIPDAAEACPNGLAPTTSALLQMALGDALAMALLDDKGFSAVDFGTFHPGGQLGAQLKQVQQVMHHGAVLPLAAAGVRMSDAILLMTARSFGCLGVLNERGALIGIITDGDLRRHMDRDLLDLPVSAIMTRRPRTIQPDSLVSEALEIMNSAKITSLFVVDEENFPIGLVHIHDLLRIGAA
jgi:arabinose-5-phosphate isomerase